MKTTHAFAAGFALAILGGLAFRAVPPAFADRTGPYQVMQHSNTTTTPGVFRVDTVTGEITYCYIDSQGQQVICSKSGR